METIFIFTILFVCLIATNCTEISILFDEKTPIEGGPGTYPPFE